MGDDKKPLELTVNVEKEKKDAKSPGDLERLAAKSTGFPCADLFSDELDRRRRRNEEPHRDPLEALLLRRRRLSRELEGPPQLPFHQPRPEAKERMIAAWKADIRAKIAAVDEEIKKERRFKCEAQAVLDEPGPGRTPGPTAALGPKKTDLSSMLSDYEYILTPRQKECISLRLEYGYSMQRIADHLHVSKATVHQHIHAANRKINFQAINLQRQKKSGKKPD